MDLTGGFGARSGGIGPCREALESLHISDEFRQLVTPENAGSFTALLELPATQAVELLHFTDSSSSQIAVAGIAPPPPLHSFGGTLPFPSTLMERAARFSVIATENQNGNVSGETPTSSVPSNSSANLDRVKTEPGETDSAMENHHSPCPSQNNRSGKRKDFEKVKSSTKKNKSSEENEKLPYVHVRARRGQATDSHSLAERARREKINARMKLLQELVPGCDKIQGTALVLDEIINHVQSLQRQVEMLSMRLAAVNPRIDFNLDNILASENGSLMDGSFNGTPMQLAWPHQGIETEQSYHHRQLQPPPQPSQQWPFNGLNQPVWGREEDQAHGNDHNSLMGVSENLISGSANLHPNQNGSLMDGSFNSTPMQLAWPHQVIETEQSYHHRQLQPPPQPPQQWPFDGLNQPVWGREEDQAHGNDHNSLMGVSENLMGGSANLHPNQVKTEL